MTEQAGAEGAPDTGAEGQENEQGAQQGEQGGEGQEPTPLEKALERERAERKRLEGELKARQQQDEAARLAAMDDNARAVEEAKVAARAEVQAEYEAKLLGLRAQTRAAQFHEPELAVSLAGLEPGMSDAEIDAALAALAKERPYLVKGAGSVPPVPQGPRGGQGPAVDANDWLRQSVVSRQG